MKQKSIEQFSGLEPNQQIAQVIDLRGNNQFTLRLGNSVPDQDVLAQLPNKLRKAFWIKRYAFVVFEPQDSNSKIKGDIVNILYPEHIKSLKANNQWPQGFIEKPPIQYSDSSDSEDV